MITYTEKGYGLHSTIGKAGYTLSNIDGVWQSSDDDAVQLIIDAYNPLLSQKAATSALVNKAAGKARVKYTTDVPYQSDSYRAKLADCVKFKADGYPQNNITQYPYVNARSVRHGVSGKVSADEIIAISDQWNLLMFNIENLRDTANEAIDALTDWTKCQSIADKYVAIIEGI